MAPLNCLAVDIGAGSGRIIRGTFDDGRLGLEQVHRFANGPRQMAGHLRWDIQAIFRQVLNGLRKASRGMRPPSSIGVDAWGVDFVLLDGDMKLLEPPVSYRDPRTEGVMERFLERIDRRSVYRRTGIQFMRINTLYQLLAQAESRPAILRRARHLLMVPDYLNFLLTGNMSMEFTNATTTQMIDVASRDWDPDILGAIPVGPGLFSRPVGPGTVIGHLAPDVRERTGLGKVPVIAPATHDTASAVASIPARGKDWAFISSGTWSLMGKELRRPVCSKKALENNFSNEGGAFGTYRFLKNIMGMWLVDGLRSSIPGGRSYGRLEALARRARPFSCHIDPNDGAFFNPRSMKGAFDKYLKATGQPLPPSPGAYVRCALEGLALSYREVLGQLSRSGAGKASRVHIIGGGCQNRLLNQMTADALGLPVYAGPVEGTAVGNLLVQAIALGEVKDIGAGRALVDRSFNIEEYIPGDTGIWDDAWARFQCIREGSDGRGR